MKSMLVKPSSALVGKPSLVASSSGKAKNARYARLLPSTRKSSHSRAGPSSSCSSVPSTVFGTGPGYRRNAMIRSFTDADLDHAEELLAERHERHRAVEPLLPTDVVRAQLEKEWAAEGASGVVSDYGFVIGSPGRHGFMVGIGGHAMRGDAERARDLYAAAAGVWVDAGHRSQFVFLPSHETALIDAWFRLSFGASGVLAIRETAGAEPFAADVTIRRGTAEDLDASWRLDRELSEAMVPSPSFSDVRTQSEQEYIDDWKDTWDDEQFEHFVAELDGHVVGQALTAHVLAWAHEHGHPAMTTDWRMTNLLASRFWPKRGFRPTFLRLHRYVA